MLKFIGIGSFANVKYGNNSAYIKNFDELLLIDCGDMVFSRIIELNLLEDVKTLNILITHNHSDHIGSLASLVLYSKIFKDINVNIVVPSKDEDEQLNNLKTFLTIQGVKEEYYNFVKDNEISFFYDSIKVEYKPIKHSKSLKSYAIVLKSENKEIYYLGDNNDEKYIEKVLKVLTPVDLVYTDCTTLNMEDSVHITLEQLNQIVPKELKKQFYCMHLSGDNIESDCKEAGFNVVEKELSKKEILDRIKSHN